MDRAVSGYEEAKQIIKIKELEIEELIRVHKEELKKLKLSLKEIESKEVNDRRTNDISAIKNLVGYKLITKYLGMDIEFNFDYTKNWRLDFSLKIVNDKLLKLRLEDKSVELNVLDAINRSFLGFVAAKVDTEIGEAFVNGVTEVLLSEDNKDIYCKLRIECDFEEYQHLYKINVNDSLIEMKVEISGLGTEATVILEFDIGKVAIEKFSVKSVADMIISKSDDIKECIESIDLTTVVY